MSEDFYRAFEARYRGARPQIKARLAVYLPFLLPLLHLDPESAALDLGCGRGEWLELLREHGFAHTLGVDLDSGMLQDCRALQLDVREEDAIACLQSLPDASQSLVSAFHVAEHLPFERLSTLIREAWRVLKPAGLLILETPNPESLIVASRGFYMDPSHLKPLPPLLLSFLTEQAGFAQNKVLRLQEAPGIADKMELSLWEALAGSSQDYAIVAQKPASPETLAPWRELFAKEYGIAIETLIDRWELAQKARFTALDDQIEQLRTDSEQAIARVREEAHREAQGFQEELKAVYASTSWRITRPLRGIRRIAGGDFEPLRQVSAGVKRQALRPLRAVFKMLLHFAERNAAVRRFLKRLLAATPGLEARLRRLSGQLYGEAPQGPDLSPHARRIFRALSFRQEASALRLAAASAEEAAPQSTSTLPRLAYVSPLPPEPSGISAYSVELLPALAEWFEIEVVVAQNHVDNDWVQLHCPVRTVEWFRAHADHYDVVLYHFGNSPMHRHMFELAEEIPGIFMLHDFFLSGIVAHRDRVAGGHLWKRTLQASHGYRALVADRDQGRAAAVMHYPANLPVLQSALGVIVHSEYARKLAGQWYGPPAGDDWAVVPHLRVPTPPVAEAARAAARQALGVAADAFLVCAFGVLGPIKLNDRLLAAWRASPLAMEKRATLIFVGENDAGDYGRQIDRLIRQANAAGGDVRLTGWVDDATYRRYLAAADVGVQLRIHSRGETSGTVLDCMNHGLATLVNAHGSFADLDAESLIMLPDAFSDAELVAALTRLWRQPELRRQLGDKGRAVIQARHAPATCARQYAEAIARMREAAAQGWYGQQQQESQTALAPEALLTQARELAQRFPLSPRKRQLLVDVSAMVAVDLQTGIQRVVRAVLGEWLAYDERWQVEPVYAAPGGGYRYARRYTAAFLGLADEWAEDLWVDAHPGDVFWGLDFHNTAVPANEELLARWHANGVGVGFLVHDLLPVTHPDFFPAGDAAIHARWLSSICRFDAAVCVSASTADELRRWLAASGIEREKPLAIECSYSGADLAASVPTRGLPPDAETVLAALAARPSFLMVGTVEPRKGHDDALDACTTLWAQNVDFNLVIVGKEGWMTESLIDRLRQLQRHEPRLLWLNGISDEYLDKIYAASSCLLAASRAEGFGLPLIEAARHDLPILARDIPVFREVAGECALYFGDDLAASMLHWLDLRRQDRHPRPQGIAWCTWKESARRQWDIAVRCQGAGGQ